MTNPVTPKPRKTHFLLGSIATAWSAKPADSKYRQTPYWTLYVEVENLYGSEREKVYVFPNLVASDIVQTLQFETYHGKKYFLECEKRVRGWRLKGWKEIVINEK